MFKIRRFSTQAQYDAYVDSSEYIEPSLAKIGESGVYNANTTVKYNLVDDWAERPFRISVLSDGNITWSLAGTDAVDSGGQKLLYKKNNGSWTEITSTVEGTSIAVVSGDMLQFKAPSGNNTAFGPHSYTYTDEEEVEHKTQIPCLVPRHGLDLKRSNMLALHEHSVCRTGLADVEHQFFR